MFPFRNILFPTDFSVHAHAGLKYAAAFAQHGRGRVVLFNAQDAKIPAGVPEQMKSLLSDPLLHEVDAEPVLVEGEPRVEIARAAIDHDIDLVTVVMRERNRLSRAFGASIAEEIVAESPCAVLAIRPSQRDFVKQTEKSGLITFSSRQTSGRLQSRRLSSRHRSQINWVRNCTRST